MLEEKEFITPRYRIIKKLGQGGLGEVFEATDLWEKKRVALKLCIPEDGENRQDNLKQEFRLTSELSHPGIIKVYDFGYTKEEIPFYTMELVEGEELSPRVAQPDLDKFYKLIWQILDILEYLHSQNITHADLKPSNFKVTQNIFSLKILDFGLARSVSSKSPTKPAGTLEYIAPEVWLGEKIDPRTDLYSLGIIMFELLTSKPPFTSEDPLVLRSHHLEKTPPPPSALRPGLPESLDSLVLKLLQKRPEDRFQNIAELKEEFSKIASFPLWGSEGSSYINTLYGGRLLVRDKEFQILQKGLRESLTESGRIFLIEGELGLGKSNLLQRLKRESQIEGIFFVQIDCPRQETHPLQSLKELFSKIWPFFQHLSPSLSKSYEETFRLFLNEGEEKRNQENLKLEKLSSFLLEASIIHPFVLAFEDLHWMDEGSLNLLEELIEKLDKSKLFICGTFQENRINPQGKLRPLLNRLTGSKEFSFLRLPTFSLSELEEFLSQKLGKKNLSEALLNFVYKNSSGVPLFALEILKYLFEKKALYFDKGLIKFEEKLLAQLEVPDSIEKTILGNLKKYPEDILNFLNLASVIGEEFDLESIKFLSGYDQDRIFEALFLLLKDRILIQSQRKSSILSYSFASHTLQSLIYKNFCADKKALHRKLAHHLEERKSGGEEIKVENIASHFILSDDHPKAYDYSFQCALICQKDLDFPQALKYLKHALESAERLPQKKDREKKVAQALMQRGNLLKSVGDLSQAQEDYERLIEKATFLEDKSLLAETYKNQGDLHRMKHDQKRGLDCLLKAKEIFEELKDDIKLSNTLNNIGNIYWIDSQYQKALDVFAKALEIQKALNNKSDMASTLNNMGTIYVSQHQYKKALEYHNSSLQIKKQIGNKEEIARSLNNIGFVHHLMGDYQQAINSFLESLKLNQEIDNKKEIAINTVNLSESLYKLGEYEEAKSYARRGLGISREIDFSLPVGYLLRNLANIDLETGVYQSALTQLKESLKLSEKMEDKELKVSVFISLGRLFFLLNRAEDAEGFLEKASEISRAINDKRTRIAVGRLNGILLRKKKKTFEALKLLENSLRLAEELNSLEDMLSLSLDFAWAYLDLNEKQMLENSLENAKKIIEQSCFPLIEPEYYFLLFHKEFRQGNPSQAFRYSELVLEKASKLNKLELVWRIYFLRGKLHFSGNNPEEAYKEYEKAGKLIKSLSQNMEDPEFKQSYLNEGEKLKLLSDIKNLALMMVGR
jgi:serine/threonine protein kinase/Tfp pilus assembly protein PilF